MFSFLPHSFIYNRWTYSFLVNLLKSIIIIIYLYILVVPDLTNGSPRMCPVCVRSPAVMFSSFFEPFLFSTCSKFILYFPCPNPEISHFFKELCFLFMENGIHKPNSDR